MQLVRIGNEYINFDNVAKVRAVPSESGEQELVVSYIDGRGADTFGAELAKDLTFYLWQHAADPHKSRMRTMPTE